MRFEYALTREDYDQAGSFEGSKRGNQLPLRAAYTACAAGFLLLMKQDEVAVWIAPALLIGLGLFLIVQPTLSAHRRADRHWAECERIRRTVFVDATLDSLSLRSEFFETRFKWEMFDHAAETSGLFLIYQTPTDLLVVIPKRSVPTGEDLDELRTLLKLKTPKPVRGFPVVYQNNSSKDE